MVTTIIAQLRLEVFVVVKALTEGFTVPVLPHRVAIFMYAEEGRYGLDLNSIDWFAWLGILCLA